MLAQLSFLPDGSDPMLRKAGNPVKALAAANPLRAPRSLRVYKT
jgi:hypothetical protein